MSKNYEVYKNAKGEFKAQKEIFWGEFVFVLVFVLLLIFFLRHLDIHIFFKIFIVLWFGLGALGIWGNIVDSGRFLLFKHIDSSFKHIKTVKAESREEAIKIVREEIGYGGVKKKESG